MIECSILRVRSGPERRTGRKRKTDNWAVDISGGTVQNIGWPLGAGVVDLHSNDMPGLVIVEHHATCHFVTLMHRRAGNADIGCIGVGIVVNRWRRHGDLVAFRSKNTEIIRILSGSMTLHGSGVLRENEGLFAPAH